MEFCPKCGKLMIPERDGDKTILICPKCGYKAEVNSEDDISFTETIEHDLEKETTIVVDEAELDKTLPTREMYCPKCKKKQPVSYWMLQTRSADESPTRFFRCTVCKYTWREYD